MMKRNGSPRTVIGVGLILMSFGSGCMDILSYRFLGEVFTSAMTGNVALMGLSLGHGDLTGAIRNISAFGGFFVGLLVGALLLRGVAGRWRFVLTLGVQAALLLCFALLWDRHDIDAWRFGLIGLSAIAMGMQSAVAHRIGVRGVTTTYFTGTLTNIAFGLVGPQSAGDSPMRQVGWPALAFLSYLSGGVMGGWYTSGRMLPELPFGLPALPLAATLILAAVIAAMPMDGPPDP